MPRHALDVATLLTWLTTEALGAFMARSWIAGGGIRAARRRPAKPDAMSLPILAWHAGLNAAGLLCWIAFLASGAKPAAWLAIVLMAPAIGLGISTVAIWTPYPGPGQQQTPAAATVVTEHEIKRALHDEALTGRLIDDFLARNLAPPPPRPPGWHLRPLVPAGHGVLAIATFSLAVLSAVSAG
jgi:hypothetical protein